MHQVSGDCRRKTGWVTAELFFWHDTQNWAGYMEPTTMLQPGEHFENPETKRRFKNLVEVVGLADHLVGIKPVTADPDIIAAIHPQSHIERIEKVCASGGGDAGAITPVGPASLDIARLAVGGVVAAVDAVFQGAVDNAYVLCRPPGHHALPELAMGFCLFANAALGIKHAQNTHGAGRIAVIDWDVHHGNGTEAIFYDDPSVLTISLHQDNLFPPDSGGIDRVGEGAGKGANLNIPLPPGSGSGAYRSAFEQVVMPALEAFAPEAIFLPCGYDASALDPLGVMLLSSDDFRWMTQAIVDFANQHCKGRIIATHEGGYSAIYVPYCGLAVLEALSGAQKCGDDPYLEGIRNYGGQDLSHDQTLAIATAKQAFLKSSTP